MTISRQHNPKDGFDMFIYEGHLGKLFVFEKQIPEENLFCKVCGDFVTVKMKILLTVQSRIDNL